MRDQNTTAPPSFQKAVSHQVELIPESPCFNATLHQIALLNFVVNRSLAGKGHEINNYTLAAGVFDRGPDFDQRIAPIVSIQADMLRRGLARYYQKTGQNDQIQIDIPDGTYVPVFKKRKNNRP